MNLVNPEIMKSQHAAVRRSARPLADVIALEGGPIATEVPNGSTADALADRTDQLFRLLRLVNRRESATGVAVTMRQDRPPPLPGNEEGTTRPAGKERNRPITELIATGWSRNLCSIEETILELYHAKLSMHQLERLVDQLWGTRLNLAMISSLRQKIARQIDLWRGRPIKKVYPYVFLAGIDLKCGVGHEKKEATVLMAMGIDANGGREVLGVAEGGNDPEAAWQEFLQGLDDRGLGGVRLFIGDPCAGLKDRMALIFPGMHLQTSVVRFHGDILSQIPMEHLLAVWQRLRAIDASGDWQTAKTRVAETAAELRRMNLPKVAEFFERNVWDTLNYLVFPPEHQRGLRSNSPQIKLLRTISERTRMVGAFSDGPSAVHLVSARLRHIETTVWKKKRYPWGCL